MEVVFAEDGKDNGLLPLNSLLGQVERLLAKNPGPEPLDRAVRFARAWVDGIFDTTGLFTSISIRRFQEWADWLQCAARTLEDNSPLPALPGSWEKGAEPAAAPTAAGGAPAVETKPAVLLASRMSEPELIVDADSDAELLREFLNESGEHLQNIEQGVLVLEDNPTDADTLNAIFRAFHTFKGGSGFLNLIAIQSLAHELESLLDQARQNKLEITPEVINVILEGGDTLKQFMVEIDGKLTGKSPAGPIVVPTLELLERIRAVLRGDVAPTAAARAQPAAADSPADEPAATNQPDGATSTSAARASANRGNGSGSSVKVDTLKLDSLVDLVGEIVIAQSLVVQSRAIREVQDQQLSRDLAQLGRITKELQRTAMSLRMVPIRATFQKMNRLVRDTAARLGKQVELNMEGEDTELDRTIVEELSDPLIHMIRNSLDHGIEKPEVRQARGKPAHGSVWLKAYYQGGNIVIEIKDDGNGLDCDRVRAKAVEQGLIRADAVLTESEVFNLIFAPGFSTAENVTDLSGRGVGMDVVRRNIDKLRGKVEIQSKKGEGSTFSIFLPLTLAIIDGLIVGVGEHRYILPTLSVCESFRPTAGMISSVNGRGEMISVRGRLQPVLRLYEHLGIQPVSSDPTKSIAVVVEAGKDARCILVDQLLGKQEVVIKSMGEMFKDNRAIAGAAILGDGRVGLILDPQALVQLDRNHACIVPEMKN